MSILSAGFDILAASAATQSTPTGIDINPATAIWSNLLFIFFTLVAVVLVIRLGVLRPASVLGPHRVRSTHALWMLLIAGFIGFCAWQFVGGLYGAYRVNQWQHAGIDNAAGRVKELLTPADWAILSTIPPLAAFMTLIACEAIFAPGNLTAIGFAFRKLFGGIGTGILAFLITGPLLMWTMIVCEAVYHVIHFEHPREHELLKNLGEVGLGWPAVLLVLGATVVAPLLEELLFRGHLQTFLRELLYRWSTPPDSTSVPEATPSNDIAAALATNLPAPAVPTRSVSARAWQAWAAIVVTSLLFASLHEGWMRPPIFVLSLALGYVYERTGNLWSSITVHLLFNLLNTLQFVLLMRGH